MADVSGPSDAAFLTGGDVGELMRAHDWSASPLGAPDTWPQSLRSVVGLLLNSKFPMFVAWGEALGFLYNDPYAEILGAKHPAALGARFDAVWPEIWSDISPLIDAAMAGVSVYRENLPLLVHRGGSDEQAWFTFSYSPARDETGAVAGMFCAVTETTDRVLAEKRQGHLLDLEERLRAAPTARAAIDASCEAIGRATGADLCTFNVVSADAEYLDVTNQWRATDGPSVLGRHRVDDYGPARLADLLSGCPERIEDITTDPRTAGNAAESFYAALGCRALLNVPMVRDGSVRATLTLRSAAPRRWTDNDVALAQEMVERSWQAAERARAEEALRDSETRLRLALDAGAIGEWELDLATDTTVRAIRHDQIFGYETLLDHWGFETFIRHVLPEDRAHVEAAFRTAAETGAGWHFECRIRRAGDGEIRWIAAHSAPQFDAAGRVTKLFGLVQDITHGKETEAALRELNETLESRVVERTAERDRMWDNSPDLMLVIGFDGIFRRVNPAWTTILGYAPDELVGRHVNAFVLPEDHAETVQGYELAAHGGHPRLENRYRHKDGSTRWIAWLAAPAGDVTYAVGRDVTAQKAQQAELETAQEALRQAQKMEAVGQLTGGLAHDFNNLLTGMMGNLELLQARIARGRIDELDRFINAAQGAGRRAAALTQRLLAFSRRQTLDPKPTDVNRLIAGLEELVRRTVGPAYDIEVVQAAGLWTAIIDPTQLENAILNLCINARDAMPDGGRLTIETANKWLDDRTARERDLPPGQYLSICVTDTGTGMTPEVAARAFDPFYTTKPIGEGTGLGLSMIYGFARQSGGQVRIYSEVGHGTTVCIYLPRHAGDAEDEVAGQRPGVVDNGRGETVLVVDDEATIRHLIDEVLHDLGYTVIGGADGAAGLKVLQSGARVDLLITDVGLPGGMNGRQVADAARALRPGLSVLFITGYAENAAVGNGHLEPGMELLTKPFAMADLTRKVQAMLAKAPAL